MAYKLNGAVYTIRISNMLAQKSLILDDTQAVVMPRSRSLDIDTKDDLIALEHEISKSH
jgi:CMP-N-acetylneuraminic acid synthetase